MVRMVLVASVCTLVGLAGGWVGRGAFDDAPFSHGAVEKQDAVVPLAETPTAVGKVPDVAEAPPAPIDAAALERCVCPVPEPPGLDPRYTEAGVDAWLEEVARGCDMPGDVEVDCSEFPCVVTFIIPGKQPATWSPAEHTCAGSIPGPDLMSASLVLRDGFTYRDVVVAPGDVDVSNRRLLIRRFMNTLPSHSKGDDTIF